MRRSDDAMIRRRRRDVTDRLERNKDAVRRFFHEIWNEGDESAIDRFIAEDAAGNDPKFGVGRESFRRQWRAWRTGLPDIHFELEELVAEGDAVVSRWTLTGTHLGEFLGAAPTGRTVRVSGMSLDHVQDGVVVSGFDGWDALGFRQQLGLIPPDADEAS
jgi:steroid delta-isomerase-like uncharacterized protein